MYTRIRMHCAGMYALVCVCLWCSNGQWKRGDKKINIGICHIRHIPFQYYGTARVFA